jgi:hypothetical protein
MIPFGQIREEASVVGRSDRSNRLVELGLDFASDD